MLLPPAPFIMSATLRPCDLSRSFVPSSFPCSIQPIHCCSFLSSFSPPRNIYVRSALLGAHPAGRVPPPPPSHYFLRVSGSQDEGGGGLRLLRVSLARFKVGDVGCAAAAASSFLARFLSPPSPACSLAPCICLVYYNSVLRTCLARLVAEGGRNGGGLPPRPAPRCAAVVVAFGGARAAVRAGSRGAQEVYLIEHVCIVGRPECPTHHPTYPHHVGTAQ